MREGGWKGKVHYGESGQEHRKAPAHQGGEGVGREKAECPADKVLG